MTAAGMFWCNSKRAKRLRSFVTEVRPWAEKKTGDKPLSNSGLKKLKLEKQKQVQKEFQARKKAKNADAAWSDTPLGRRGPGVFAGMCA